MEPEGRGVLDTPAGAGFDGSLWSSTSRLSTIAAA